MNLEFKSATAQDKNAVFAFNKQQIDLYENANDIAYEKVLNWVKEKLNNNIHLYTRIEKGGELAGYYYFHQQEDKFEIDDLYLFENFTGQGIGSFVIEKCLKETNLPVFLYVFTKNVRAVSLYRRLGFKTIEEIKNTRLIMEINSI